MADNTVIEVDSSELQRMFNEGKYWERAKAGEFKVVKPQDDHPAFKRRNIPRCTRSQLIGYFDESNNRIALLHQYRLSSGELGASGKPDPKLLLVDGIIYSAR